MNNYSDEALSQYELLHQGKVRDSYRVDAQTRLIVVTDRISAFNRKIKTPIPGKGAILNSLSNWWFAQTKNLISNHLIWAVSPNKSLVREAEPIRIEMVVRGYLAGSIWRGYERGEREFYGYTLPEGMHKHQAFEQPLVTPTTKDEDDSPLTEAEILEKGLVSPELWQELKAKALALFGFGQQVLQNKGILLVDTKYEFGLLDGQLILIDEIHTPDSSRFWDANQYAQDPLKPMHLDKEFLRYWLLEQEAAMGELPEVLPKEIVAEVARRYAYVFQRITGLTEPLG